MIKTDRDALACDLAETYQIYDMREHPLLRIAVFACGLRDDSRIKLALSQRPVGFDSLLLAAIFDCLRADLWTKCREGTERPKALIAQLLGQENSAGDRETVSFASIEEFEKARQEILGGDTPWPI